MALIRTYRRYLHRMRMNYRTMGEPGLESAFRAKQEAQPGNALPASFPLLSTLLAGGYEAREDLDGADVRELQDIARMRKADAEIVLTAFAALPPLP